MRLAAIDIGTNASRLLISEVTVDGNGTANFNKLNLIRVPLRLGFDVFETQTISPEKEEHIIKTIKAYRALIDVYGVTEYIACATSAMPPGTYPLAVSLPLLMSRMRSASKMASSTSWVIMKTV